jgi:FAD/FMN-containing dehydrogenase
VNAAWIVDEVMPSRGELAETLRARREGPPWVPRGGGTLLGRGRAPIAPAIALDLSRCRRVIEHADEDLTVTVEAGMPLLELQAVLGERGQWLPLGVDPDPRSTVGGWIGGDRRSPLAGGWGSVRDHLLGITFMNGRGQLLQAGGRVVKNVAGYDLMKVFTGSLGQLGIVIEATFKVLPRPATWGGVLLDTPDPGALRSTLEDAPKLFPTGAWRFDRGSGDRLALVFAGSATRVAAQMRRANELWWGRGRPLDHEHALELTRDLERATRPGPEGVVWGGCLPEFLAGPEFPACLDSTNWTAELLRGHLWARWMADDAALERVRTALRAGEGHLHLDPPPGHAIPNPWGWEPETSHLEHGLKQALDPDGRFVGGRWPGGR